MTDVSDQDHSHDIKTPKPVLVAVGLLLASVTGFVAMASVTGVGVADLADQPTVERLEVRFMDEADGGVGAYDPMTDDVIHVFAPGEGGFVRTSLRSLSLDRRKAGIGPTPPYELLKSASSNVVLRDPTTGKSITLRAFGDLNENDFAQLFAAHTEGQMP
ncbi:MAG: photosynthetic complex assembly protein PuhC [Henriciella sp.]|uniref:photosynthetic complex assembly protein PuhC n=1 Tax=Henriciella sp. TaxID=1968823 RepID=UPI003C75C547